MVLVLLSDKQGLAGGGSAGFLPFVQIGAEDAIFCRIIGRIMAIRRATWCTHERGGTEGIGLGLIPLVQLFSGPEWSR